MTSADHIPNPWTPGLARFFLGALAALVVSIMFGVALPALDAASFVGALVSFAGLIVTDVIVLRRTRMSRGALDNLVSAHRRRQESYKWSKLREAIRNGTK